MLTREAPVGNVCILPSGKQFDAEIDASKERPVLRRSKVCLTFLELFSLH